MPANVLRYAHPAIGHVLVKVLARSRSIRAHWVGPELHVTVPPTIKAADLERFLTDFADRITSLKPSTRYHDGQIIDGCYADFELRVDDTVLKQGAHISVENSRPCRGKARNYIINLTPGFDFDSPDVERFINKVLLRCAKEATADFILPRARQLAASIGRGPKQWLVRDSRTRLGSCSSRGNISLSSHLIFMPLHLVDYVIYHELAHLSEMNHSAAFHRLCNSYCGGREAEYRAQTKSFKFPVF